MAEIVSAVDLYINRKINIKDLVDLDNWSKTLGCSVVQLIHAVEQSSDNVGDVKIYIDNNF